MSANVSLDNAQGCEVYLKNALVALKSVKDNNADVDVALITNFELSPFYCELFEKYGIARYQCPFEDYAMPPAFTWSLAFYKMTAIKFVTENLDYDYYLELESDELCLSNFDDMWAELDDKLLVRYSPFRRGHPGRGIYTKLYDTYLGKESGRVIEKTGAGFIAGSKAGYTHFVAECDKLYAYMMQNIEGLDSKLGDELYPSIYCALFPERTASANPYVDVYWTGKFYRASTNYAFDAVSIVHLPAEKETGLVDLFDYLLKKGKLPPSKKIYKMMSFPKAKPPFSLSVLMRKIARGLRRRLRKIFKKAR